MNINTFRSDSIELVSTDEISNRNAFDIPSSDPSAKGTHSNCSSTLIAETVQYQPTETYAIFTNFKSRSSTQTASRNQRTVSLESTAACSSDSSLLPENEAMNAISEKARYKSSSTESIASSESSSNPSTGSQHISRIPRLRACRNATKHCIPLDSPSSVTSTDPFDTDGSSDKEYIPSEAEGIGFLNLEADQIGLSGADEPQPQAVAQSHSKRKKKMVQEFDFNKYIGIIKKFKPRSGVGNKVRCEICMKYKDILKMYGISQRNAQITSEEGTGNRTDVLESHLLTPYHIACMKKHIRESERGVDIDHEDAPTTLEKMVLSLNAEKANTISRYMMSIYTDAKILTSSAFSWPARIFTNEYARKYDFGAPQHNQENMLQTNLQYMNPVTHLEFLQCIVEVDRNVVTQKLDSCRALSVRADGSIDRTHIDKIYVLAQTINADGDRETLFLGIGEKMVWKPSNFVFVIVDFSPYSFGKLFYTFAL